MNSIPYTHYEQHITKKNWAVQPQKIYEQYSPKNYEQNAPKNLGNPPIKKMSSKPNFFLSRTPQNRTIPTPQEVFEPYTHRWAVQAKNIWAVHPSKIWAVQSKKLWAEHPKISWAECPKIMSRILPNAQKNMSSTPQKFLSSTPTGNLWAVHPLKISWQYTPQTISEQYNSTQNFMSSTLYTPKFNEQNTAEFFEQHLTPTWHALDTPWLEHFGLKDPKQSAQGSPQNWVRLAHWYTTRDNLLWHRFTIFEISAVVVWGRYLFRSFRNNNWLICFLSECT